MTEYKCYDCDKSFQSYASLRGHRGRMHPRAKLEQRDKPQGELERQDKLQAKLEQGKLADKLEDKPWKCDYCDFTNDSKSVTEKHEKSHTKAHEPEPVEEPEPIPESKPAKKGSYILGYGRVKG